MDSDDTTPFRLLFVCSRNRIRSLTAEHLFQGLPGWEVRSVGTRDDARIRVTPGHLGWAEAVVVMEKSHLAHLRRRYPEQLAGKTVVTLHLPDEFQCDQPELMDELLGRLAPEFPDLVKAASARRDQPVEP